jgi:hypothetical protein
MKRLVILFVCVGGLIVAFRLAFPQSPRRWQIPDEVNLGSVARSAAFDFTVPVRNTGGDALAVLIARKSCGCIVMADSASEEKPVTIPPGSTRDFHLRMRPQAATSIALRQTVTFVNQYGETHTVLLAADLSGRLTSRPSTVSEFLRPWESRTVELEVVYNGKPRAIRLGLPTSSDAEVVRIGGVVPNFMPVDPRQPGAGTLVATLQLVLPPLAEGERSAELTIPLSDEPGDLVVQVRRRQEANLQAYPKTVTLPRVEEGAMQYRARVMLTWRGGKPFRVVVGKPPVGLAIDSEPGQRQSHVLTVTGDGRGVNEQVVVTAIDQRGDRESVSIQVQATAKRP